MIDPNPYTDLYIHTNTHHININAITIAIASAMSNLVRPFIAIYYELKMY